MFFFQTVMANMGDSVWYGMWYENRHII